MNQNTYLNYGVYKDSILFMALGGNFASKAWTESDERFHQIAGTSFQACTGDDGQVYNIGKYNIRRLKSDEEFAELWKQSHPAFRIFCQVEKLPRTWKKEIEWNRYQNSIAAVYKDCVEQYPDEEDIEGQLLNFYKKDYSSTPEELEEERKMFEAKIIKK